MQKASVCYFLFFVFLVAMPLWAADDQKVVIPFDFVSKFDDGRYGQIMGDMMWKKLSRERRFVIPETMLDVRDYCANHSLKPSPEMALEQIAKIVKNDFDAQIGIWGSIERAPGEEAEIYDLVIKCVDFSTTPAPTVLYDLKTRTNATGEIAHVYVKAMFDALYGRKPDEPDGVDSIAEDNWKNRPNLVAGDFQRGARGVPHGWSKVCGQQQEPLGRLVRWMNEEGNRENRLVHFTLDRAVAEFEGVMYYSEFFPVEEGAKYRFQCRFRSKGPAVKVFIKCYDEMGDTYRGAAEKSAKSSSTAQKPGKNDYLPEEGRRREVYRSQQPLSGPTSTWTWQTHTEDFSPKHTKYTPKWGRVMLYAYLVPGEVEFDDVVVKEIESATPGAEPKVKRHSTDSKITIKEMEENERRSQEIKVKPK
jgi:hypothetical protein